MEDTTTSILFALVAGVLTLFGMSFFSKRKNDRAIKEHTKTKEEVLEREMDIARSEGYLAAEEDTRKLVREQLSKELDKELSNEDMVDFINDRYND